MHHDLLSVLPLQADLFAEITALEAAVAVAAAVVAPLQQDVEVVREAMQEQRSSFHELRGSHQVHLRFTSSRCLQQNAKSGMCSTCRKAGRFKNM